MLDKILEEFGKISDIPHKSGHEKAISDYLLRRAQDMGLEVVQDRFNNVIIERPAASGYEDAPLVILQAHMDMVCVSAPNSGYDPLEDCIELINDGKVLTAKNSSLGADNGIGVAVILYILQSEELFGPIRAVFTVDEESSMVGAIELENKYLAAEYLINCDSEDYDILTVSSAGGLDSTFSRAIIWRKSENKRAVRISLKNLLGGHSGIDINKHRCNAIKALGLVLADIEKLDIGFELEDICGGNAKNAIPSDAYCVVTFNTDEDLAEIEKAVERRKNNIKRVFDDVEKFFSLELEEMEAPAQVLSVEDTKAVIDFICLKDNGVIDLSAVLIGTVETSSNLGIVNLESDLILFEAYARSSKEESLKILKVRNERLASVCGFKSMFFEEMPPVWPINSNSRLAALAEEIFVKQNNKKMRKESIHAGLECSFFYKKNPELDIISIGPNIRGAHSVKETLYLDSIEPHVNLVLGILKFLCQER